MTNIELLTKAIKEKHPISFDYNKEEKVSGIRIGNPHAIFIQKKKDGSESIKVHIYQTGGVTDSPEKGLPNWKLLFLENISEITIHDTEIFTEDPGYNPNSSMYNFVIEKL